MQEQVLFQILFFVSIVAILGICAFTIWFVQRNPLQPFARNLLIGLIIFELALAVMHILAFNSNLPPFLRWFFDMDQELNLPTIFSSLQLFVIFTVAMVNAFATPGLKNWQRAYWVLLAAVFFYFSIDEFYEFHETFGSRVPTEAWRIPYAIGGSILLAISAFAVWFGFRKSIVHFVLMFTGLFVMAISGIGIEEFVLRGFVAVDQSARWMYLFEELFEMVGATIVLATFLSYAQYHLSAAAWPRMKPLLLGAAVVATGWYSLALLVLPGLEARFFGTPLDIEYDNGLLTLVGYRLPTREIMPGGEIELTLYWRANEALSEDYSLSIHLLRHKGGESVAQSDDLHMGPMPATAMYPGVIMRRTIFFDAPRSLPTPGTYDLMARVWYGPWPFNRPWEDTTGLEITRSGDRTLFAHDAILLDRVTAAPTIAAPAAEVVVAYEFPAEGFALTGYALSEEVHSATLPVKFWWQTRQKIDRDLTQFLHLQNQDSGELFTFDQPPFNGSYPTSDWAANAQMVDEWQLTLPEAMPAGSYTIYTGLYDLETLERSPVTDAGAPLEHNSITLGTLIYDPVQTDSALPDLSDYCYAVSNQDLRTNTKDNDLFRIHRFSGEVELIGRTGTFEAEALAFSPDGRTLYTIEKNSLAYFGTVDLETGEFTPRDTAIAVISNPATSTALGTDILNESDSLAVDPVTGRVWSVHESDDREVNFLFEINPATGEVVRDTFGPGVDYILVDLSTIPGEARHTDIEELAIDPRDGTFYIIASNDEVFDSWLARIDFDTLDPVTGTVQPVTIGRLTTEDGEPVNDMEGLSFYNDGTLYGVTSNNSTTEAFDDSFWEIDPQTATARFIESFRTYVQASDFEGIACYTGATAANED